MRRATCTVVVIRPAIALFLPTLSMRRATGVQVQDVRAEPRISTHALHAESDQRKNACSCVYWNFYPRSPCGERRRLRTSPLKEAIISTHALHAESDLLPSGAEDDYKNFYPRSPCGERHLQTPHAQQIKTFLPTLSMRRATRLWQRRRI